MQHPASSILDSEASAMVISAMDARAKPSCQPDSVKCAEATHAPRMMVSRANS